MVDKAVGMTKMKHDTISKTLGTPSKCRSNGAEGILTRVPLCDAQSTAESRKDLRLSMASSQSSYWEGDDELKKVLDEMGDCKVEKMLNPSGKKSRADNTSSASSGSTSSSTLSGSTIPTSLESPSPEKRPLRRKRVDGPEDGYPFRRTKTPSGTDATSATSKESDQKKPCFQPCAKPMTVSAAHQRTSRSERPIPRNICDPGRSAPVTSISRLTVSTVEVGNSASAVKASTVTRINTTNCHNIVKTKTTAEAQNTSKTMYKSAARLAKELKATVNEAAQGKLSGDKAPTCTPVIVAHDEQKQKLLDRNGIAKGVQFEIARGITQGWWTWEDVTEDVVKQLRGTCFEKAGKVATVILKKPKEQLSETTIATRQAIYAELDREQDAFLENEGRGLGLKGPWEGKENWHGGCIQLTCKLEFGKISEKDQFPFVFRLNSFGIGKSNRAARRVTSLSILQVKFEKEALYDEKKYEMVTELLNRNLVICGRRYEAFCTKESKVFFVETRRDYQRQPEPKKKWCKVDRFRLSYSRFVKLFNPLKPNEEQAMNKWLARWQLILSTSRPVVEFDPENIYLGLEDIYGDSGDRRQTEGIMTDGCGLINLTALRMIAANLNSTFPVVVQGRIAGAKGLWLLHPSPEHRKEHEPPKIWIRRSQNKINLPEKEKWDRSLRIFDLVRLPRLTVPSSLNMQTIMNISYNGVADKAFVDLMETGLKKEIDALTKWDGDYACVFLARAVEEAGGIMSSRRSRAAGGDARLYNYDRDEGDDDDDDDSPAFGGLVERDPISGYSQSLYESARDMLVAGFSPLDNAVLRDKLKYILLQTTKAYLEKFHIPVVSSAEAFIAPDPYGVLEEGQIYFRCSTPVSDPTTCVDPHTFLGPVLVSRNPTRVASDIRKVTAVSHDQLLSYTDVIIFSVKGKRSLASYLGGGDYDGDTVSINAEPSLVEGFRNSDHIPEPPAVRESFEEQVERVSDFLRVVDPMMTKRETRYHEVKRRVLGGLSDGKVGRYSKMHDNAIYELGYSHETTIRLAYMFTTCLDAVKSGLRIQAEVFKEDSREWNIDRPECMHTAEESSRNQSRSGVGRKLCRPKEWGPFVLETLRRCAKELGDQASINFETLSHQAESSSPLTMQDDDLARPYNALKEYAADLNAPSMLADLDKIEGFVRTLCEEYISELGLHFGNKSPRKNGGSDTDTNSKSVARIRNEYAKRLEEGLCEDDSLKMPSDLVKEAKASYAHIYGTTRSKLGRGFGFTVAADMLGMFKIRRKGGGSFSRECRDFTSVSNGLVKVVKNE